MTRHLATLRDSKSTVRRPGKAPKGAVPSPSPDRHATTRSRRGSSSSSLLTGYGSILPTSLAYIVPSTRGYSPWRPDAVMSTTGHGLYSILRIFKGRRGRTEHYATCGALPSVGPYLRLSRFQGGQAVSAQLGIVTQLSVHPASPVLLTKNSPLGALDSLARLNEANSCSSSSYPEGNFGGNQLLDGLISLSPLYPSQTNDLHVSIAVGLHQSFLWLRPAQAYCRSTPEARAVRHDRGDGIPRAYRLLGLQPRVDRRTSSRRSTSDRDASPTPIRLPPNNFKHFLTLFSKSFSFFPHGTCSLSVSRPYLALDGIYRPIGAAFPNNPTRRQCLITTIRMAEPPDSQVGLFPVRSPLLGESL
ncbi:hypothetical protein Pfo_015054 [Paulownia fortunei]|nr:hypothetical protein Pfo_015054 [Paulownia fortunei]